MAANVQFLTNEKGDRVSVVLPVAEYEELLEDLEDLARIAERREEPAMTPAKGGWPYIELNVENIG
ncbi:MAG: hypothetical protein USCGTAYLOR_00280 [Chromatiales bacterium USCg_Taylor]|nr:MAG: hypothetical protein USCGTAYLOR_00280 [Chromatiales bacterium USCg_Taylor]